MSEGAVRLAIRLMGTAEASVGGSPLGLNQLKPRALLFYLAATGQSHTRDHLATLLWGESGQSEAYHSLRSSLYHLRKALKSANAEEALISDGGSIGLSLAWYECDATEFDHLLKQGSEDSLSHAVARHKGPFLQGFSISDAPMFEDWVQMENTRLTLACSAALNQLTAFAEEREAWEVAIGYLNQMIRIDPLSESAQQRLMRLYLRQEEVGLALRQYRQFESQLWQEVQISPSPETQALFQTILQRQKATTTSGAVASYFSAPTSNTLPFVGRDHVLQQLIVLSNQARADQGTVVLVQGEGGIGKSRLLEELASHLISGSPPWQVLYGACSPFDDLLSHGPFLEALQNVVSDDLTETDGRLPDARGRFSWQVLQSLQKLSRSSPVLLIIDDLQWANSSTLNLFGFLSMRIRHLPIILAGTVQHAEAIPAVRRLITLKRRRGELYLFPLASLTLEDVTHLVRSSGIRSASIETFTEWLHAKSVGSPFLLNEILAQLRVESILQPDDAGWQLSGTRWLRWRTTFQLPETAHDLVGWRLANLSSEALHLLNVLAVAGQPLPEILLDEFPHIQAREFPNMVDDLVIRGLVVELPGGMLALPHHLLRETLLHRLSSLRRRTIYKQLAEALEKRTSREDKVSLRQMALYSVAGEDIPRARRYGLHLLPNLPQDYTGAETVDFIHHLHDLLASNASTDEMVRLTRALGVLHQSLGHLEVAAQWHGQNLHWAQKADDLAAQVDAYFEMSELALMSNDYPAALQAAKKGLEVMSASTGDAPSVSTGRGQRLLGAALAMEGRDLAAAEEHLQTAVEIHRQNENQSDQCAALFELGNVAAQRGDLQRALEFYEESARVAEAVRIHYYLALACNNIAYHSLLLGRLDKAERSIARGIKVAEAYDLLAALLHLYSTRGEIFLFLEQWQDAEESFQNGLAIAEELGSLERQAGYRGGLALAARGKKDFDTAQHLLEDALTLIAEQGYWHLRTRLQLWLAETLFEQAYHEEAAKILEEALQVARAQERTLLVEEGERLQAQLLSVREA